MVTVDEARSLVLERVRSVGSETVGLEEAAGRVLRAPVDADRDFPPFDRAAMDGFAIRSIDASNGGAQLHVVGEVRAGQISTLVVASGQAARIMTGAPVPAGADAVVQVERTRMDTSPGEEKVLIDAGVVAGQNIVPRGSESRAGARLLESGLRIHASHLAVLASVGCARPIVARRPRVAILVTGDEVVPPSATPLPAQIRNANGPALVAAVEEAGGSAADFGIVIDEPGATRTAIARALDERHDAIVLSGGVSAGNFDFVEGALAELGVSVHVTAVQVKPGAPFVFGTRGETLIFGLPGNPVSAQVTFELFVRPALLKMQDARALARPPLRATLTAPLVNRSGRRNYLPVLVTFTTGGLEATPLRTQGSGDTIAHARANALAVLGPEQSSAAPGDDVAVHPLPSFLEI